MATIDDDDGGDDGGISGDGGIRNSQRMHFIARRVNFMRPIFHPGRVVLLASSPRPDDTVGTGEYLVNIV